MPKEFGKRYLKRHETWVVSPEWGKPNPYWRIILKGTDIGLSGAIRLSITTTKQKTKYASPAFSIHHKTLTS